MKQQSLSFERALQLPSILTFERSNKYMLTFAKQPNFKLQCNGGKLEEAEDFKYGRLALVQINIDQLQCVIC